MFFHARVPFISMWGFHYYKGPAKKNKSFFLGVCFIKKIVYIYRVIKNL